MGSTSHAAAVSAGDALPVALGRFLSESGVEGAPEVTLLRGGANNRVYRVCSSGDTAVLKVYFAQSADGRDRFAAERAFYGHAVGSEAASAVPAVRGWSGEARAGLFEFVEGMRLTPEELTPALVCEGAAFVRRLQPAGPGIGGDLPPASEAAFSVRELAGILDRRVERLRGIRAEDDAAREAQQIVAGEIAPRWADLRARLHAQPETPLPEHQRWISPSDFGFHNSLSRRDGSLCFFDFEYAGWDDVAKLASDFFWQPEVPVSWEFMPEFLDELTREMPEEASILLRMRLPLLFSVFGLKWCCIVLNEFLRDDVERRKFALPAEEWTARRGGQLDKVRRLLERVGTAPSFTA